MHATNRKVNMFNTEELKTAIIQEAMSNFLLKGWSDHDTDLVCANFVANAEKMIRGALFFAINDHINLERAFRRELVRE